MPLRLMSFVASVEMLAWAKAKATCNSIVHGGHLAVLKWAREHGCPWGHVCAYAAAGGHLKMLQWAREHHCPWDEWTLTDNARPVTDLPRTRPAIALNLDSHLNGKSQLSTS